NSTRRNSVRARAACGSSAGLRPPWPVACPLRRFPFSPIFGRLVRAMTTFSTQQLTFDTGSSGSVSALLIKPTRARACFVFAHGAGAGMAHPFMATVAAGLGERGIATLRYQFPYMEKGSKRPDAPALA